MAKVPTTAIITIFHLKNGAIQKLESPLHRINLGKLEFAFKPLTNRVTDEDFVSNKLAKTCLPVLWTDGFFDEINTNTEGLDS